MAMREGIFDPRAANLAQEGGSVRGAVGRLDAPGSGFTLGAQTYIDGYASRIRPARAAHVHVNRNMIGAVVA